MMTSKRLIFFGNERLATGVSTSTPVLKSLIENGYDVSAVVVNSSPAQSRNARPLEIAEVARTHSITLLTPNKTSDIEDELAGYEAVAGVLAAYGRIIPQSIIDIFPCGIINIHPSLLPVYRGPTPLESALLDGLEQTGVSLMSLGAQMDNGPIYAQKVVSFTSEESKQMLADKFLNVGSEMLIENLPGILDGTITPRPQDETKATYTKLLEKADGEIIFSEPAEQIARKVRAFQLFPKAKASILGQKIIILEADVVDSPQPQELTLECNPGYLKINSLVGPSGKTMSGSEFLRGYRR